MLNQYPFGLVSLNSNKLLFGVAVCIAHKCPFLCFPSRQTGCGTQSCLRWNEWGVLVVFSISPNSKKNV